MISNDCEIKIRKSINPKLVNRVDELCKFRQKRRRKEQQHECISAPEKKQKTKGMAKNMKQQKTIKEFIKDGQLPARMSTEDVVNLIAEVRNVLHQHVDAILSELTNRILDAAKKSDQRIIMPSMKQ